MTDIKDFASEPELNEFGETWKKYRKTMAEGVVHYSDDAVRNLFAEMSMIQAHAEMRLGISDANYKRQKWIVELTTSKLLVEKYKSGAMNARMKNVETDLEYGVEQGKLMDLEHEKIIADAKAKASATAANSLSREISIRIKT